MFGARREEESDENSGKNRNDMRRFREGEQQSVMIHQQNLLIQQQSVLMEQQSVLMAQQNILMEQQKILMDQQKFLMDQQNVEGQHLVITGQQNIPEHLEQANSCTAEPAMQQSSSEDPWKIKKVLQDFDLTLRLLVAPRMARNFMLPVLNATDYEIEKGFDVEIWDVDTQTTHSLFFTKKSQAYILVDNWINDFVFRRGLRKGDEIGLSWDPSKHRFNFSVLSRHTG